MAHPFEPTMTPSQMYQVNRPALERSTSASGSWADRRQPPTAAKYRNLPPDENEDVPELEHELDDAEPDFELEEEWVEHPQAPSPAAPGLAFCACMHPCSHRANNRRSSSSIGVAARPSPVQSSYSYSFDSKPYRSIACPTLPIIVADVPLSSSSAGPSPSLGPTGLTFARRSSSTAGGPPTSSRSSGSFSPSPLPPLSSQLPPASIGWMSRSMSVQHQKSFAHAGSKSNTRDFSSPDPTHDSSDALPSAPLPFTGISRKRSCTGPPPPLTPFSSSMNTAASTNVAAGAIAHHHHTHRRQTSGSSLNSPNAYGSGYGYRNLSQLPVPPVHYPTAGRSPIVTPSLFQSTPLPQAEFRKPPIASSSSSSFVSLSSSSSSGPSNGSGNNPDADHCSRNRSFTGPSINATPSPRYPSTFGEQQEFLPQAHDRAQSPHTTKVNGHADRRGHMLETSSPATSAAATTALGTSAPSQAGRAMWMVGSAPVPSNSGRGRFDGFLLNQPAPPLTKPRSSAALEPESDFSAATNGPALDSEARLTPLRLLAPFQSNYSSGELNVVGEDENENEGDEAKTTAAMNGAGSAYHHTTNFHPDHFENGRSGSAGKVSGLVGLGFKVGSRDDAACEGMAPHIAPATEEFHATLVGNGITAVQDDDDDDP